MISTEQFDELVKLKRRGGRVKKCKPGVPCRDEQPTPVAPPIPEPTDPERSAFAAPGTFYPVSLFTSAQRVGDYTHQLNDLAGEMGRVQNELANYTTRIAGGTHSGLGSYVEQGNRIMSGLQSHHDRTRHKQDLHSHLSLSDLQMLYDHAVYYRGESGNPHPPSHPIDARFVNSRTALIEALTHKTSGYGAEPMQLLQYYHSLTAPPPPPPPPP